MKYNSMRYFILLLFLCTISSTQGQGGWTIIKEGKYKRVYYHADLAVLSEYHFEDAILYESGKILLRHHGNWWLADSSATMISMGADELYKDRFGNVITKKNHKYRLRLTVQNGKINAVNAPWCDSVFYSGHNGFFQYRSGDSFYLMDQSGKPILPYGVDVIREIQDGFTLYKSARSFFLPLSYAVSGKKPIEAEMIDTSKKKTLLRINGQTYIWCEEKLNPVFLPDENPVWVSGDLMLSSDGRLLNKHGKILVEKDAFLGRINEELLYFGSKNRYGLVRPDGKVLLPAEYDNILFPPGVFCSVFLRKKEGEWIWIDAKGKITGKASDVQIKDSVIAITSGAETRLINAYGKQMHCGSNIRFFTPEDFSEEGRFLSHVVFVETEDSSYLYSKSSAAKILSGAFRFMFYTGGIYGFTNSEEVFVFSESGQRFFPDRRIGLVSYFGNAVFLFDFQSEKIVLHSSGKQLGATGWKEVFPLVKGQFVASDGRKNFILDEQGTSLHSADSVVVMDRSAVAMKNRGEKSWKIYVASERGILPYTFSEIQTYQTGTQFYAPFQYRGLTTGDTLYFSTDEYGNFSYNNHQMRNALRYPLLGPVEQQVVLMYSNEKDAKTIQYPLNYNPGFAFDRNNTDTCIYRKQILLPGAPLVMQYANTNYLPAGLDAVQLKVASEFTTDSNENSALFRYVALDSPDYIGLDQRIGKSYFIPSPLIAKRNGKWGVIALNQKILLPFEWDELHGFRSENADRFIARRGDTIRVFDENCIELFACSGSYMMPVYAKNTMEILAFIINTGGKKRLLDETRNTNCLTGEATKITSVSGGNFYCYLTAENTITQTDTDRIVIQNPDKKVVFDSGKQQYSSPLLVVDERSTLILFKKKELTSRSFH